MAELAIKVELTEELKDSIAKLKEEVESKIKVVQNTAWLVETIENCNSPSCWLGIVCGNLTFSSNANDALRFKRKEDAEAMCRLYVDCIATEHMWMDV